jgi:hypothetical protein
MNLLAGSGCGAGWFFFFAISFIFWIGVSSSEISSSKASFLICFFLMDMAFLTTFCSNPLLYSLRRFCTSSSIASCSNLF